MKAANDISVRTLDSHRLTTGAVWQCDWTIFLFTSPSMTRIGWDENDVIH